MFFLILLIAIFFAANMGGSSFAAAFASIYGGKVVSQRTASYLFITFVLLGAALYGGNVTATLGEGIVASNLISPKAILIIFIAASLSMFIGNLLHIPQSTSLVTVAAIAGVGVYFDALNVQTILFCLGFWLGLPILSFILTYILAGYVYPPRRINFWVYEKFVNQQDKLKIFVIVTSCYNAFSVGTNNVANVVGPLAASSSYSIITLLIIFALFYGMGSFVFPGALKAVGEKVVPLGLLTVSIISFVSGTLMLVASSFGVPQSFVMLQMGALFAISVLKHGSDFTIKNDVVQKTLVTWSINPLLTFGISLGLAYVIL